MDLPWPWEEAGVLIFCHLHYGSGAVEIRKKSEKSKDHSDEGVSKQKRLRESDG